MDILDKVLTIIPGILFLLIIISAIFIAGRFQAWLNRRHPDQSRVWNLILGRGYKTYINYRKTFIFLVLLAVSHYAWQTGRPGSAEKIVALYIMLLLAGIGTWLAIRWLDNIINRNDLDRYTVNEESSEGRSLHGR
jgi:hypothetical protein